MTVPNEQLKKTVEETRWFHSIDFGSFASSGRFPKGTPQNRTLYGAFELLNSLDMSKKSFLDVGAADGLASFGVEKLGAEEIHAIDSYDLPTFRLAKEILDSSVNYHPGVQIKNAVEKFGYSKFDVILCAGVIYHMLNPASAFHESRKLLKDGGVLIMETPVNINDDRPVMTLNSEDATSLKEIYTYWVPTISCVQGMMQMLGFDIIATRFLKSPARVTVMGRAVSPDKIRNKSEILERIHEVDFCDFEFSLKEIAKHKSSVDFDTSNIDQYREIDGQKEEVSFPLHPGSDAERLGTTRWMSENSNY